MGMVPISTAAEKCESLNARLPLPTDFNQNQDLMSFLSKNAVKIPLADGGILLDGIRNVTEHWSRLTDWKKSNDSASKFNITFFNWQKGHPKDLDYQKMQTTKILKSSGEYIGLSKLTDVFPERIQTIRFLKNGEWIAGYYSDKLSYMVEVFCERDASSKIKSKPLEKGFFRCSTV